LLVGGTWWGGGLVEAVVGFVCIVSGGLSVRVQIEVDRGYGEKEFKGFSVFIRRQRRCGRTVSQVMSCRFVCP
jgi:hypothetical protein